MFQASCRYAHSRIIGKHGQYPVEQQRPAAAGHAGSARSTRIRRKGAATGTNYTWHGDQDPSQPWWNGTQNCDVDLSDMRFSKMNTSWGKNFVENKMPEAHWKLESIERGARLVVITPEYNPTAYTSRLLDSPPSAVRWGAVPRGLQDHSR